MEYSRGCRRYAELLEGLTACAQRRLIDGVHRVLCVLAVGLSACASAPRGPTVSRPADASSPPLSSDAPICDPSTPDDCVTFARRARKAGYLGVRSRDLAAALARACARQEADACFEHARLLADGPNDVRSLDEATKVFRALCTADNAAGCVDLLGCVLKSQKRDPADVDLAIRANGALCERGRAPACTNLAVAAGDGVGMPADPVRAAALTRRACEGGDPIGCTNLAIHYRNGNGVQKSDAEAVVWNTRGCDGGDAHGCNNLGDAYENGRTVPVDVERARALYERACTPAYPFGCVSLGELLLRGVTGPADLVGARASLQRACDWGSARGCGELGALLIGGTGSPADAALGRAFLRAACSDGYLPACRESAR